MSNTLESHCIIPAPMPSNITVSGPPTAVHRLLTDVLFAPLRVILATAGITRKCILLDDISFAILCVMRCLQNSKTGRDFLQTHAIPQIPDLTRSNDFASLKSPRRLTMMRNLARHLRADHLPALRAHDNLLATFPELNDWEVWAGDGHFMEHATHDPRNEKDPYAPVGAIYKLDTRTGWAEFLDLIQPTAICITHNLLHLFKVTLKTEEAIEDTKVIDAYHKDLDRREANAQKAGRVFPKTLYIALYRPTELSLQFIRWIRIHLSNRSCYRQSIDALRPLMASYL